jgi:zinc and cadmium transporter
MNTLAYILIATAIVSIISLVGVITFGFREKTLKKMLLFLVAFSAGGLMGAAFLHLLPEALATNSATNVGIYIIIGFSLFYIIERVLHWRHCHDEKCHVHTFTYMSLIGDGIHNFIDGVTIAISFLAGIPLGVATTIAIIAHEIPHEMGNFAVLVHGGFGKLKALLWNFLSAIVAIVGALFGFFLSEILGKSIPIILPFAAGGFIYVSASDLIPELHNESLVKK